MTRFERWAPWLAVVLCLAAGRTAAQAVDPQLTLPPRIYAVPGVPCGLWFDNVVLTEHPEAWKYQVTCDLGDAASADGQRWLVTPKPGDAGEHQLLLEVTNAAGDTLAKAATKVVVAKADAGAGQTLRLLIVGDSLTGNWTYPPLLAALFKTPGNPTLITYGGGKENSVTDQSPARHEGYGGWTWDRFVTHFEPQPNGTRDKMSSPFVFAGADGKPALDIPRYILEKCGGQAPEVVTLMLGINDCFHVKPDDPKAIDQRIDAMFVQADKMLAAWRAAAPKTALAVAITPPGNSRESGFEANYHGNYHRWGWKRIQHRLVQRQLQKFSGREAEGLYLLPTELNLDPTAGFPVNNGVHPNADGYKQIAQSFYAWLKCWLQARG